MLQELYVNDCQLSGRLPPLASGALPPSPSLRVLDISNNFNVTGTLATAVAQIASMINLEVINLSGNGLGGTVPTSLGALNKLTEIRFSSNRLVGRIPAAVAKLSALKVYKPIPSP